MEPMPSDKYSTESRRMLLDIARYSIAQAVSSGGALNEPVGQPLVVDCTALPEALVQSRAVFVTLTKNGELRGCTGSLQPRDPLASAVSSAAYTTAFDDPRFAAVGSHELADLCIEISVLSPLCEMFVADETELYNTLHRGVDGLVIDDGVRNATFLPKMWESLPEPSRFVGELKNKAGMPYGYWSSELRLFRYQTETFTERPNPRM